MNWFPNPAKIAGGVAINKLATPVVAPVVDPILSKVQEAYNEITGNTPAKSTEDYLEAIHILLVETATWLKNQPSVEGEIYKFVRVYHFGQGAMLIPSHIDNRQHFQVWTPVQIILNAVTSGWSPYSITVPPITWFTLDMPDGTQYTLDASVADVANVGVQLWMRETNVPVV